MAAEKTPREQKPAADDVPAGNFGAAIPSLSHRRREDTKFDAEFEQFARPAIPKIVSWLVKAQSANLYEAAEATQAAMADLVESWASVHTNPLGWCMTVARRHFLHRKFSAEGDSYDDLPPSSDLLVDRRADVVAQVEARLRLDGIAGRIAQLTPREREVLLQHLSGFSHKEIAENLECSDAVVRVHLSRARRAIDIERDGEANQ